MMSEIDDTTRQHPSVTDLIFCLTNKFLNVTLGEQRPAHSRQTQLFFVTGIGLENAMLIRRRASKTVGEFQGIHYHADSLDGRDGIELMEFKSTRMSVNKPFEELPESWFLQTKSYCKIQGTNKVTIAVLHVIPPELICWDIEYTQEEIDEHWAWMLERKEVWDNAVATGEIPEPFKYNRDYECKNCPYFTLCEAKSRFKL